MDTPPFLPAGLGVAGLCVLRYVLVWLLAHMALRSGRPLRVRWGLLIGVELPERGVPLPPTGRTRPR